MIRVRVYRTMRIAKAKYLEYCEHNIGNIKMKRFNGSDFKISKELAEKFDRC